MPAFLGRGKVGSGNILRDLQARDARVQFRKIDHVMPCISVELHQFNVSGKHVIVAGGSKGLGRELSLELAGRGAHVTVIARSKPELEETRQQMQLRTLDIDQIFQTHSLDLADATAVTQYVESLPQPPTTVFCVAGGAAEEMGFFVDMPADAIRTCMEKNYFSSAYIAHAVMRRWVSQGPVGEHHHLVFTASTAALVAVPGYAAYAPTKAAVRALADGLRQEALLYESRAAIHVHCTFPGTIYTDSFYREQARKPALCKEIEGTSADGGGISAGEIARLTMAGLDQGRFFITTDLQTRLLLNNMRGPSPKDLALWDWVLGFVASLVWPLFRIYFDRKTVDYGKTR